MKKVISILCLTLFLFSSFTVFAAEVVPLKGTAVVDVDKLNVRSGPSKEYKKLGTISKNTEVEVIGIVEPDWYVIEFEGEEGYINSEYVLFTSLEEIEGETGAGIETKQYVVMALVVAILIISGIGIYTFVNLYREREEEEELPVVNHEDTNMHLGEITYDTYRIDIDPKYFEQTTIIPQPESIIEAKEEEAEEASYMEEIAEESHVENKIFSENGIHDLDSKLEQASAQIAALQKEVEQLKKSQT